MPILTDKHCEAKVAKRTKIYDAKCTDLYVDILPSGVATFCFKRPYVRIGVYHPADDLQAFTVKEARIAARDLKNRIDRGEDVSATTKSEQASFKERQGLTVNKLIDKRIDFMKAPVRKRDGKNRPNVESWKNVASHLERFVRPAFGRKLVGEVTRGDIAKLADQIVTGKFGKSSPSIARHVCMAISGMFKWAVKREFINSNPATLLGEWTNNEHEQPRQRVLAATEIKQLWNGLDNDDLPHDRRTRLALKFELVSMLRGCEFLPLRKDEIVDLDGEAYLRIPLERVKNRKHDILQPLSSLAVEIIREALKDNDTDYVFATPQRGGRRINEPLGNQATSSALRDRTDKTNPNPGICSLLGIAKFTPHDLRRTAATVARASATRNNGVTLAKVSMCLDHAVKREDGMAVPDVTRRVYVHAHQQELDEKRQVLEVLADAIRHIVSSEQPKMAKAA
jgi:integrase